VLVVDLTSLNELAKTSYQAIASCQAVQADLKTSKGKRYQPTSGARGERTRVRASCPALNLWLRPHRPHRRPNVPFNSSFAPHSRLSQAAAPRH